MNKRIKDMSPQEKRQEENRRYLRFAWKYQLPPFHPKEHEKSDENEPVIHFYYDGESPISDEYTAQEWEWIKRIEVFLEANPQAEWGPGHVVLSDYNFQSIDFCLGECEKLITGEKPFSECPTVSWDDVIQTKKFLLGMKATFNAD